MEQVAPGVWAIKPWAGTSISAPPGLAVTEEQGPPGRATNATGPEQVQGSLRLAFEGQANGSFARLRLVVSGPERGHVWIDDRAGGGGIRPVLQAGPYSFLAWYEGRIDEMLAEVDGLYRENARRLPKIK
jgi:hypothetical protein